jgi:RNA polymerase subunit RPABC4/transcription elongation factor Spt4
MGWICPDCESINHDDTFVKCNCGYEVEDFDRLIKSDGEKVSKGLGAYSKNQWLSNCQKCGKEVSKRAEECPNCGIQQTAFCHVCKTEIPTKSSSCPQCGDSSPFDENIIFKNNLAGC